MCTCENQCEACKCSLKTKLINIKHIDKDKIIINGPMKITGEHGNRIKLKTSKI